MIIDNGSNQFNVTIAGPVDVCHYCLQGVAKDLVAKGEEVDVSIISEKLRGKLSGQKIWRLRNAGTIVICKKHIKKICELIGAHHEESESDI
jgi:hypothetical protein